MEPLANAHSFGAGRFVVRGTLGAGGAGVVYRVWDHQLGREVALKVLRQATGRDLYRFKREFRALADIVHPNLVALHELHSHGDEWFFTMELIEGVSFIDWVRPAIQGAPGPRTRQQAIDAILDENRLRNCVLQLADALVALHQSHKLHRDLKPSNVLVTATGRAVLLDFGLVSGLAERNPENLAVGTPAYMSPEQAADLPLAPASDWYSLGAMLYEALTGRRPFEGAPEEVMRKKQTDFPPPPSQLAPDVTQVWEALTLALLHPQAVKRPDGLRVLASLGGAPSAATRDIARNSVRNIFVGRPREVDFLRRAFSESRRRGNTVFVKAPSGMGKSTLVRHALTVAGEHAFVLEGRCFERESVPFKMLDGVVDSLAGALVVLAPQEQEVLVPREVASLLRLFPVMRRVPQLVVAAASSTAPVDPQELRLRGFASLRHLLGKLAKLRPVYIFIDDVHWGDHDSAAFLCDLLHRPDANMCIVLAHRPEDYLGVVAALRRAPAGVNRGADIRDLEVPPMSNEEAKELVSTISSDDWRSESVIPAAGGNPLVLSEMARAEGSSSTLSIDALVASRAARLSEDGQSLLVVTSVAGRPLPVETAAYAAGLQDGHEIASQLAAERLAVLRRVGGQMMLQPAHDYVRSAVVGALSTDVKAAWHEALARALEAAPGVVDSQAVVEHWLAAGHPGNAAAHAIPAALVAEEALAFRRAADMYQIALTFGTWEPREQRDLLRRQAQALTAGGQLDEAAAAYGHSASLIGDEESVDLERLRVEQLLRRGRVEEALPAAERLLAAVGTKLVLTGKRPLPKLATQWVQQRIRGIDFVERQAQDISAAALRRIDVLYSIASGLGFCDPLLGRLVQSEYLRAALDGGEPFRICMALSQEIVYQAAAGPKAWPAVEVLASKLKEVGLRVAHPHIVGVIDTSIGFAAHLCGRWREARLFMEAGLATLRNYGSGVRWEVDMGEVYWLTTLWYLGEWREFTRLVPSLLRDANERGDLIAQFWLRAGRCNFTWLIQNRPDEARTQLEVAENMIGENYATVHHVYVLLAHLNIDLYTGEVAAGWARLNAAWPTLERMFVMRVQNLRIELQATRARLALMASPMTDANLKIARHVADELQRETCAWGQGIGLVLGAAVQHASGQSSAALNALQRADALFVDAETKVWRQVARFRRGQCAGGSAGMAQTEASRDLLNDAGVVDPERMMNLMAPWPLPKPI